MSKRGWNKYAAKLDPIVSPPFFSQARAHHSGFRTRCIISLNITTALILCSHLTKRTDTPETWRKTECLVQISLHNNALADIGACPPRQGVWVNDPTFQKMLTCCCDIWGSVWLRVWCRTRATELRVSVAVSRTLVCFCLGVPSHSGQALCWCCSIPYKACEAQGARVHSGAVQKLAWCWNEDWSESSRSCFLPRLPGA